VKASKLAERATRQSILLRFYHRYLSDSDTARFIASVAGRYSVSTLERLVVSGDIYARRASALALGLIGDGRCNSVLGPYLRSSDRKLRLVVDDALRAIWLREGSTSERQMLERIVRLNECGDFQQAVELATQSLDAADGSPELYHQRSLAQFQLDKTEQAIDDCHKAIKLNPFHYAAMIGLGHCCVELGELQQALYWFRKAVEIYPDLEPVRAQIRRLEKTIQGQ
jgi:tetratricopeptide (TPR) repeat protein